MEIKSIEQNARLMVSSIMTNEIVNKLQKAIYDYDNITFIHSQNVAYIIAQICNYMELYSDEKRMIVTGALLHDIGKISIPKSIISKKNKLTMEEYEIIKSHTIEGYEILKKYGFDENICNIALMHHEKEDGSGYPNNEKTIPTFVQLISLVDSYDAMTAARPYGIEYSSHMAIEILKNENSVKQHKYLDLIKQCNVK